MPKAQKILEKAMFNTHIEFRSSGKEVSVPMKIITIHHGDYVYGGGAQFMSRHSVEHMLEMLPKIQENLFAQDGAKVTLVISGPVPRCMNKARLVGGLLKADGHVILDVLASSKHYHFPDESEALVHQYVVMAIEAAVVEFMGGACRERAEEKKALPDGVNVIVVNHDPEARRLIEAGVVCFW